MIVVPLVTSVFLSNVTIDPNGNYEEQLHQKWADQREDCSYKTSCKFDRYEDNIYFNCICGEVCAQYNTCCKDSDFRDGQPIDKKPYKCLTMNERYSNSYPTYFFMIDSCDSTWSGENSTKELCQGDPAKLDNLFLFLPVTNTKTRITYRNYFCALCNNDTDDEPLVFWEMSLGSKYGEFENVSLQDVHFYPNRSQFVFSRKNKRKGTVYIDVRPKKKFKFVDHCIPGVISECAKDWNDTSIQEKCDAYMSTIYFYHWSTGMRTYRNIHCAVCNYQDLGDPRCTYDHRPLPGFGPVLRLDGLFRKKLKLFSKTNKCDGSLLYDTVIKQCRTLKEIE